MASVADLDGRPVTTALVDLGAASRTLRASKPTWIYFIQAGADGPVKVGIAKNPKDRLSTLQTAHAEKLTLLAVWRAPRELEAELHAQFADCRLSGEWFSPTPELLTEAAACAEAFGFELREFRGEGIDPWPLALEDCE